MEGGGRGGGRGGRVNVDENFKVFVGRAQLINGITISEKNVKRPFILVEV